SIKICHAAISGRVVLARFGKDPHVALETRDAMNEFWQAVASYAFDGQMPEPGKSAEVSFGGGDEQFVMTVRRLAANPSGGDHHG
ncbi:hypothetical protein, partial [Brucella sp. 10RB9210]|uniref:hypothetical protein n=1 Tax=Brucella sp. 10RB9210 TaxID=1844037 RepID=UPI00189F9BA8